MAHCHLLLIEVILVCIRPATVIPIDNRNAWNVIARSHNERNNARAARLQALTTRHITGMPTIQNIKF
jgi:hypothetical protein